MSILTDIQNELKVPKKRTNSFGGFKYRSCEDIVEAVKPLLKKYEATLTISDTVEEIGERIYVKATAEFNCKDESARVTAYAREAEEKRGMDDSQITGTASSYARKYALNGLFLIDDTKDADTDEYAEEQINQKMIAAVADKKIGKTRANALQKLLDEANVDSDKLLQNLGLKELADMTEEQHADLIRRLNK